MKQQSYIDPARNTRLAITVTLVLGGAVAGALVGVALTPLGKIVAGAPPADVANYVRNAVAFGIAGACSAPIIAWSVLRSVPLWRTVAEPLAGAVAGAGIGVLMGSGAAFLALIPLGGAAAAARLAISHAKRDGSAGSTSLLSHRRGVARSSLPGHDFPDGS